MLNPSLPTYLVTGASAGIGNAVANDLASRGHNVIAVARSQTPLQSLAKTHPSLVHPVIADLSEDAGVREVVTACQGLSNLHGIVHAAGSLVPLESYVSFKPDELVEHFRIHVATPVMLYQQIHPHVPIKRVLFIDSYSASAPRVGWSAYSIVKAAAQMAARCASQELVDTQIIRAFPGAVRTQIVDAVMASDTPTKTAFAKMLDAGQFAEPHESAAFLASILVELPDDELKKIEVWDYNDPDHRAALVRL